ncbi:hypothetical protein HK104_009120 [Borealophlyctis nickersoniae]|nr:hypothetical protein HK104_009120 [Borealophlyctis nickersoniae]
MPKTAKRTTTRPEPYPTSTPSSPDDPSDSLSDVDLDDLLARATQALEERQQALLSFTAEASPLTTVTLDPGVTPSASSYIQSTTPYGPARLDPSRLVVVNDPASGGSTGPNSLAVDKHGVKKLVVAKAPEVIPPELDYDKKQKQKMKVEKQTAGPKWFDMPAPELTEEVKRDLHLLRNRAALDPKRFYKKGTTSEIPKFFQFGTIVAGATDFQNGRLTRKERKQTIVEELLSDQASRTYFKKKSEDIRDAKARFTRKGKTFKKRK